MATAKKKETTAKKGIAKNGFSLRLAKIRDGKDFEKSYDVKEAIDLVKQCANANFDETIEVAMKLGIDVKQSDQNVRGVVSLPNGTGKKVSVAVFARDEKADAAKKAGADIVGAEELIDEVAKGNIDFDRCIATPDMMPLLSKVAKVLGPKGLMPNPKLGSVTEDVAKAVEDAKAGQVEYRAEKGGIIHAAVGKVSFETKKLEENINVLVGAVVKAKPSSFKGVYFKKLDLSSSMGVGVNVDVGSLEQK